MSLPTYPRPHSNATCTQHKDQHQYTTISMCGQAHMLTQTYTGDGGDSDARRKLLVGEGESHPRSGMHNLFMMENFSRALGRGGEMKGMSRSCFRTTSHIWNLGLQLDLVILSVLLAQRDLSLWQSQNGTKRSAQMALHSFRPIPSPVLGSSESQGSAPLPPRHTGSWGRLRVNH